MKTIHLIFVENGQPLTSAVHMRFEEEHFLGSMRCFTTFEEFAVYYILTEFKIYHFIPGNSYAVFFADDNNSEDMSKWIYLTYLNSYKMGKMFDVVSSICLLISGIFSD